ncbi:3-oxoacyl-[acyl-carrier-protein] synthase II [Kutzneria viridogrisea]|uniref:3-oxoacyl-[acyl-carrier-protein] synthase II n=1 Tax=Kutzneria viridogrisea TaxID=47990 RepID=A0ABR6B7P2_9PSEU|nr:3-oxoacyl-[acyl-carrier-protein] synthase II [Kutzneria viridogrisea]
MRRVAITGVGAVTPLGLTAESTWDGLRAGRCGITGLDTFDARTFPVRIAGQVRGFDPESAIPADHSRRHLSRAAQFGVAAAYQALDDAGADWWLVPPHRRGAAVGATVGRPELQDLVDMSHRLATTGELPRQAPGEVLRREQNLGVRSIALAGDCRGPVLSLSTACAGAGHAIGEAFRSIQDGDCDLALAGGFDALTTWMDVLGFTLLGALSPDGCRPFDATRSGFVLGEGAVLVVLEEWDTAQARGARVHGELVGYGSSLNAYRLTDSPPDGGGAISAMSSVLAEAGLAPSEIDYIAAHGTGTRGNDLSETVAIKQVFGRTRVPVSSPKSMTGHLTSAAAGVNLLAALGAIRTGMLPPTINLHTPDPRLDLDHVPLRARPHPVRAALVNAFAFGGSNACLAVRRAA